MTLHYIHPNEPQYNKSVFPQGESVDARYRHAAIAIDQGNIFIEALPKVRSTNEIQKAYEYVPPGIDAHINPNDKMAQFEQIKLLQKLRFPLPFQQELEQEFYGVLIDSYRNRRILYDDKGNIPITYQGEQIMGHSLLVGDESDGTSSGIGLIGLSGSGKSSSIKFLVAHYPQVIFHHLQKDTRIVQIVYLIVTCSPNSNFRSLYANIGRAIDRALGNIVPVYEKEVVRKRTLGEKADFVRRCIEVFSIGVIIFDEIELLDFASTNENSYSGLMVLANETKVGMVVVGTEVAYETMFQEMQTTRRLGNIIEASAYCANKRYFSVLCYQLFQYQWIEPKIGLTQKMIDVLFKECGGIIHILMSIYQAMQIDYIELNEKPKIDGAFIKRVMKRHFPGLSKFLEDPNDPILEQQQRELMADVAASMKVKLDHEQQNEYAAVLEENALSAIEENKKIRLVTEAIMMITDEYTKTTIEKKTRQVLKTKAGAKMNQQELSRKVYKRLKTDVGSEKRPKGKRAPKEMDKVHVNLKEFIENN